MHWIRSRQRRLSRLLLVAFCASWLQLAILPCTMAHVAAPVDTATQHPGDTGTDAAAPCHEVPVEADCVYCLGAVPAGCDYPQDARADVRDAGGAFAPLPGPAAQPLLPVVAESRWAAVPDTGIRAGPGTLLELYCRRQR